MLVVYLSYGSISTFTQTRFSITSLLHHCSSPVDILVYTDQPSEFLEFTRESKKIHCLEITKEDIERWMGPLRNQHRAKIQIIADAGRRYLGPLVYCDSDTIFTKDPADLFGAINDRTSLMHVSEGALKGNSSPLLRKIAKFCSKHQFVVLGETVAIGPATEMWNAGIVGISEHNKSLLPAVLDLTDQLYSKLQKHVMEQLAFSFVLQTKTKVLPANEKVEHYWKHKETFVEAIEQFFIGAKTLATAQRLFDQFRWPEPPKSSSRWKLSFTKIVKKIKR